jgi:hypothetical protein
MNDKWRIKRQHDQTWRKQRPERPYKNMAEASLKMCYGVPEGTWTCWECRGNKRIVDPNEQPDVVEGHKFSRRIDCPNCQGTGQVPEWRFRKWYLAEMKEWKKKFADWQAQDRLVKHLLQPLTPEEYGVLYSYFRAKSGWF